jgi:hypothetical protein
MHVPEPGWQLMPGAQTTGVPRQMPATQASPVVHMLPSEQGVPSVRGVGAEQVPEPGLHVPARLH